MAETGIGAAVRRKEDYRFLTGKGNYTDDINRSGQVYAYFVRSTRPHAKLKSINAKTTKAAPGVVGVFTGDDLAADGVGGIPCACSSSAMARSSSRSFSRLPRGKKSIRRSSSRIAPRILGKA